MNDLVSIIVTSYNHAEYLDQRMESLLKQTYDKIEIIVIDDCSTDESIQVLEKFKKHSHIEIVALDKNTGYANACNMGVKISSGDYIMFAECDDYNEPRHLEILMECMCRNENIGVVYCKSNMVDSRGTIFGTDFQYREKSFKARCNQDTLILKKEMQKYLLVSCVIPNMSAALIRKKYFNHILGLSSSYRACADWDFWCRISRWCDFYYITMPLNNFRTHRTTVRNTAGIAVSMTEILMLLHNARVEIKLTALEILRFNINIGLIWADYFISNPSSWFRCFPAVFKASWRYNRLNLIYLLAGFPMKIKTSISGKIF